MRRLRAQWPADDAHCSGRAIKRSCYQCLASPRGRFRDDTGTDAFDLGAELLALLIVRPPLVRGRGITRGRRTYPVSAPKTQKLLFTGPVPPWIRNYPVGNLSGAATAVEPTLNTGASVSADTAAAVRPMHRRRNPAIREPTDFLLRARVEMALLSASRRYLDVRDVFSSFVLCSKRQSSSHRPCRCQPWMGSRESSSCGQPRTLAFATTTSSRPSSEMPWSIACFTSGSRISTCTVTIRRPSWSDQASRPPQVFGGC